MRSRAFSSGDTRREVAVSWSAEHEQKFGGSDQENNSNTRNARNSKAHRSTAANNSNSDASTAEEPMNTTDLYTTEIVRVLFGPTIGAVVADYSCTYKAKSGRLYVSTNALCYYSNLFSSESKYILWFAEMVEVTRIKSSGVCIGMKTNTNGTAGDAQQQQLLRHNFRSFRDRDAVYHIINRLRLASPSSAIAGIPQAIRRPPERATTFDAASLRLLFPESQDAGGGDAATTSSSSRLLTKSLSSISESSSFNKWSKKPKVTRRGRKKHRRIRSQSVDSFDVRRRADTGESGSTAEGGLDVDSSDDDEGHSNDNDVDDNDTCSRAERDEAVENLAKYWLNLKERRLKETVLHEIHLPCSLDEFYEQFIANDCPHSFGSFQKSTIGDFELEVKKWEKNKEGSATNSSNRIITFRHPLKHKLGPKDASMEKRQQLHLIPGHGILLKSCTYGKGFPAADAFHVEDMWIIEPRNADESGRRGSGISMSVFFQIQYSKSTMFKKMIDASTKQEYTQMYDKYVDMVTSALGGEIKPGAAGAEKKIEDETPKVVLETSTVETPLLRMVILFAIAMMSILVLAYYISVLRSRIASLEEQMGEMRQNMLVMQEVMAAANDNHSPSSEAPLLTLL